MEKRKILLVDDSKLFLEMQRTFLNRDSFDLFTARTGREALDSVIKLQPHLVLLSFSMPDMPGDEICSAIKKDLGFSDTRVAIVIDDPGDDIPTRCVDAGCDGSRRHDHVRTKPDNSG